LINEYISLYGKRLYGLCVKLCGNTVDADDLYQETWLKAYQKIMQYDTVRSFEGWITGICVNTYRDLLRKQKRSPVYNQFSSTEEKDLLLENVAADANEDFSDLHAAIDRLPEKMRTTVILHYFHGLDEKKTAEALKVPAGTIKSRLHQAKKLLRKELAYESDLQF